MKLMTWVSGPGLPNPLLPRREELRLARSMTPSGVRTEKDDEFGNGDCRGSGETDVLQLCSTGIFLRSRRGLDGGSARRTSIAMSTSDVSPSRARPDPGSSLAGRSGVSSRRGTGSASGNDGIPDCRGVEIKELWKVDDVIAGELF